MGTPLRANRLPDTPTRISVMLDFPNRPSKKEVIYLEKLAVGLKGTFNTAVMYPGQARWFLVFSFPAWEQANATKFWERALLWQGAIEGNSL